MHHVQGTKKKIALKSGFWQKAQKLCVVFTGMWYNSYGIYGETSNVRISSGSREVSSYII